MKHTSKLLTALLLTMAFLVSALPVHGIHAEPETATVQKKAELVFVIDSTGSMSGAIKNVKTGITSFVNSLETQGVNLRIGIVEYRDIEEDGMDSTIIHELNHSLWMNSTSEMVEVLNGISAGGGGDDPETVIDGLGYDVRFFPYNWLEDLNDSVKKLERDIRKNHYDSVIFVTHSTGGLLASAFIAKSDARGGCFCRRDTPPRFPRCRCGLVLFRGQPYSLRRSFPAADTAP